MARPQVLVVDRTTRSAYFVDMDEAKRWVPEVNISMKSQRPFAKDP